MAELSKYQKLHKKVIQEVKPLFQDKEGKELFEALSNGENSYLRFDRIESSAMDMTWIKRIEDVIPDLNEIVSNPKKTIQTLSEVVEVEKVKKTSRESVQHLASHTQFVKSIDEEGNVTPSKILNVYNDDFFAIYENKFIATLVRRLFVFVEKRYQYIIHQATLRDVELLYFKNRTNIDGSEIEIETRIRYSKPALDDAASKMKDFLRRIDDIRKYLRFFTLSEFMKILHRERDVRNPILQTNIIRKNPKYRNCYHLWQFINSYMESGLEVKVDEKYSELKPEDIKDINKILTINFLALKGKNAPKEVASKKVYKPRILKTYDDEIYIPDKNFDGPIKYIRVDDKFRAYREQLKDLNPHPTKAMAEYLKDEYEVNKVKREETKQIDSLIKRKEAEYKKYEKDQAELLEKEKRDWQMVNDLAEQKIIEEQEAKLKPVRDMLMDKGEIHHKDEVPPELVDRGTPPGYVELELVVEPEEIIEKPKEEIKPAPKKEVAEVAKKEPKAKPKKEIKPKVKKEKPVKKAEPKKEKPIKEKPEKKEKAVSKPVVKEEPKVEKAPVVEPPKEEPKVEEKPVVKEEPKAKEKKGKPIKKAVKKKPVEKPKKETKPKPVNKVEKKKQPVKKEKPAPAPVKVEAPAPAPVVIPSKPKTKQEKKAERKAKQEEIKAKKMNLNSSRRGKKFGRR